MGPFYSDVIATGSVRYGAVPVAVAVYGEPQGCPWPGMAIGVAGQAGRTEDGLAIWRLTVDQVELPWRFLLVDGEFWPAR